MKSIKEVVINGTVVNATPSDRKSKALPRGKVLVAQLLYHNAPSESVSVSIEDDNGSKLVSATPYTDWTGATGGDYMSSKKPMNFNGNRTIDVVVAGTVNQTADFDWTLLLIMED